MSDVTPRSPEYMAEVLVMNMMCPENPSLEDCTDNPDFCIRCWIASADESEIKSKYDEVTK